jgi:hypothetical protein
LAVFGQFCLIFLKPQNPTELALFNSQRIYNVLFKKDESGQKGKAQLAVFADT